jgi:predicted RNA-binding Zn-ribbon protein involved in translation (DUF1610 family)
MTQSWGESTYHVSRSTSPNTSLTLDVDHPQLPQAFLENLEPAYWLREVRIAGWPFRCVWGAAEDPLPAAWKTSSRRYVRCSPVVWPRHYGERVITSSSRGIDGRLPIGVLWSRFIPNVLIHAAIIFGVWRTLVMCSRHMRQRRHAMNNRCHKCGYDRSGLPNSAICPECGNAPTRQSGSARQDGEAKSA